MCYSPALLLELVRRTAHGRMLDRGYDDVATMRLGRLTNSAHREIVGFGASRCEDNFVWPRVNKRSNLPPRVIYSGARLLTKHVDTRSVAELFSQIRQHRVEHARIDWCRSAVV